MPNKPGGPVNTNPPNPNPSNPNPTVPPGGGPLAPPINPASEPANGVD